MTTRTLLLTLAGPQQAWGTSSRFATRSTGQAPTRSGVLGLVAAALGMDRTATLDHFRGVRFGVRIDRPGRVERDFQTARTLDGKTSMPLSHRYYLADAVFVVGLETDHELLGEIHAALRRPRYPLYLGRRAFPPAGPIPTKMVDADLRTALTTAPWQKPRSHGEAAPTFLEMLLDAEPGGPVDLSVEDDPISFDPRRRRYGWRDIQILRIDPPGAEPATVLGQPEPGAFALPVHDPMLLVSEEEV
ncbi:type I-E CRISPR-associated protein Cas5/CasD [Microbacterium sp. ARD32]|uniref:type I-E CRISPR-associated protein Cas5/CasD n=1 Tax=Microbacterium sp. ARD32 TaxID=2962577 RepID=UPI0028822006|nr:type I-E CRISPR-associated protein Cas5/CasD [Microbacterium sp. ARD32]MDT0157646.1 type I-E CRISPR-associated protein Cas5/CasD [Microbacterium sp. ARD32]